LTEQLLNSYTEVYIGCPLGCDVL